MGTNDTAQLAAKPVTPAASELAGTVCGGRLAVAAVLWGSLTLAGGLQPTIPMLFDGAFLVFALVSALRYGLGPRDWWDRVDPIISVAAVTAAAHQSGGLASPLIPLYGVAIIGTAILLGPAAAGTTALASAVGAGLLGLLAVAPSFLGLPIGLAPAPVAASGTPAVNAVLVFSAAMCAVPVARTFWLVTHTVSVAASEVESMKAVHTPLLELAANLQATADLGEIVQQLTAQCRTSLGVEWAFLYLGERYDLPDGAELTGRVADAAHPDPERARRMLAADPRLVNTRVVRALGVFAIDDLSASQYRDHPLVTVLGARTAALVPLVGRRGPLGVMLFADTRPVFTFDEPLLERAKILTAQGSAMIENALLIDRVSTEADRVSDLLSLAGRLGAVVDLNQVLDTVATQAGDILGCEHVTVLVRDAEHESLVARTGWGSAPHLFGDIDRREFPEADVPLAGRLPGGTILKADGQELGRLLGDERIAPAEPCQLLAVPMLTGSGVQGAMLLGFMARDPNLEAMQLAEGVAHQGALAVENAQLVESLRRANRLKSDFLATMSHELRTPLNIIVGYTDILTENGGADEEQVQILQRVRQSALQLHELVNATLELNRMDAGRAPIKLTKFTVPEFIRELDAETADIPRAEGVALRWEVPHDITPVVTDRFKLKTVVKNLVGNALKFTQQGAVTVNATLDPATGYAEFTVRDTGMGMRPEDLGVIFEMFRQVDSGDSRRFGGVGLGLYIVRRLIDQLSGEISVDSTPGQGSVFTFRIPVTGDEAPREQPREHKTPAVAPAPARLRAAGGGR